MAYNKFIKKDGTVMLDLTADSVTEANVESGKTFHKADGTQGIGTYVPPTDFNPETDIKVIVKVTSTITNISAFTIIVEYTVGESDSVAIDAGETVTAEFAKDSSIIVYIEGVSSDDGYSVTISDLSGAYRDNYDTYPVQLSITGDGSFTVDVVSPAAFNLVKGEEPQEVQNGE